MLIGNKNRQAYVAYIDWESLGDTEESRDLFFKHYKGEWVDEKSFAAHFVGVDPETYPIPEWAVNHIDYESVSSYLFSDMLYAVAASDQSIYVFAHY